MAAKDVDSNLEDRLPGSESPLPNINKIWDLRRLLKSSQERLEELEKTSVPDHESMELERSIIKGVNKEIIRLERETLYYDVFFR